MSETTKPPPVRKLLSFEQCRARMSKSPAWPPAELSLPATDAGIERGRGDEQRSLLDDVPVDDSRAARLARLAGDSSRRAKR